MNNIPWYIITLMIIGGIGIVYCIVAIIAIARLDKKLYEKLDENAKKWIHYDEATK